VEDCYRYHGDSLPLVQPVDLGTATTGTLVHYLSDGIPGSTVYWIEPVSFQGKEYQERISLILDLDHLENKAVPPVGGAPHRTRIRIVEALLRAKSAGIEAVRHALSP